MKKEQEIINKCYRTVNGGWEEIFKAFSKKYPNLTEKLYNEHLRRK